MDRVITGEDVAQPPHDQAAEDCALGAMLISKSAIPDVLAVLNAEDFYIPRNGLVFTAIQSLFDRGEPADPVTVVAELEARGNLHRVGGAVGIHTLTERVPTAINAGSYARIIAEKARLRRLAELGIRLQQLAYDNGGDSDSALAEGEALFRGFNRPSSDAASFADMAKQWRTWQESDADVIATPWYALNERLAGGLQPGRLYVLGGRPGMGKTVAALNLLTHAAEQGKAAFFFSLEMPATEVTSRILASGARVPFGQIIRKSMERDTYDMVDWYINEHRDLPFRCVDKADITVEQISVHCRAQDGLDLVAVDYAQLVAASDKRVSRDQQVAHVSRSLKVLAKDLKIPVVLAAQLNRQGIDSRTGKSRYPTVADLRESGSLEADADAVLLLHRPEGDANTVEVVVGKNRSGQTGAPIPLAFMGHQARIA